MSAEGHEARMAEQAKSLDPQDRDLMQTLLAADVPFERAVSLIADEMGQAVRGGLAEYAHLIREYRMAQFPEGSEVHRRLGMIADMLDPEVTYSSWD